MENTYWNDKGKYSKEYKEMFDRLVPSRGDATTQIGQVLRSCSNLYYEYYNNGNCNVFEEEFVGLVINDTYEEYINIIKNFVESANTEKAKKLQKQINNLEEQLRNDPEMCQDKCIYEELYEGLIDSVMEALLEMPQTTDLK